MLSAPGAAREVSFGEKLRGRPSGKGQTLFPHVHGPREGMRLRLFPEGAVRFADASPEARRVPSGATVLYFCSPTPCLADSEFIYRERRGSVILRNVETNTSTVLIEGKKIVSPVPGAAVPARGTAGDVAALTRPGP